MHVNPGALVQIPLRVIFFQSKIIVTVYPVSLPGGFTLDIWIINRKFKSFE